MYKSLLASSRSVARLPCSMPKWRTNWRFWKPFKDLLKLFIQYQWPCRNNSFAGLLLSNYRLRWAKDHKSFNYKKYIFYSLSILLRNGRQLRQGDILPIGGLFNYLYFIAIYRTFFEPSKQINQCQAPINGLLLISRVIATVRAAFIQTVMSKPNYQLENCSN